MEYTKHFDKTVDLSIEDGIATITFCCPQNGNKCNDQWQFEYLKALEDASWNHDVKVIVLRSEGDMFLGSGDVQLYLLPVLTKSLKEARRAMYRTGDIIRTMYRCRPLIISAMDAPTEGGGCGITLNSDLIFATENVSFNVSIFTKAGLLPDSGGLYALQRLVGPMKAKYLALRPGVIDAHEAEELGMVTRVVPSESLYEEVYSFARMITELPPLGVSAMKQVSNRMNEYSLDTYLQQEAEYIANQLFSKDYTEMKMALKEGRKPIYVGE